MNFLTGILLAVVFISLIKNKCIHSLALVLMFILGFIFSILYPIDKYSYTDVQFNDLATLEERLSLMEKMMDEMSQKTFEVQKENIENEIKEMKQEINDLQSSLEEKNAIEDRMEFVIGCGLTLLVGFKDEIKEVYQRNKAALKKKIGK